MSRDDRSNKSSKQNLRTYFTAREECRSPPPAASLAVGAAVLEHCAGLPSSRSANSLMATMSPLAAFSMCALAIGGMIPRFHRAVCDLYGAIGVKAGVNSHLLVRSDGDHLLVPT